MNETIKNKRWEVTVYEKAEHWTFSVFVEAVDSEEAKKIVRKDYGSGYVIRSAGRA